MNSGDILLNFLALGFLPLLLITFIFACFAGFAAGARGRNEGGWFFVTLIFGPIALLSLALFPVDQDSLAAKQVRKNLMKWCPKCFRAIATNATKCCYCHSPIDLPRTD